MHMPNIKNFTQNLTLSQPMAIVIAGFVIAGAIVYSNLNAATSPVLANNNQGLPQNVNIIKPSADDHIIGSPDAEIVLVEYLDFQCGYCKMIEETLERIVSESNGKIAWVMRNLPLTQIHPEAVPSALAAECVAEQKGNEGYWQFAKTMLANQPSLGATFYEATAKALGVDVAQYQSCVSSKKYQPKIDADAADAMKNGASGTPFTVIYGHGQQVPLPGALPYEQLKSIIQAVENPK